MRIDQTLVLCSFLARKWLGEEDGAIPNRTLYGEVFSQKRTGFSACTKASLVSIEGISRHTTSAGIEKRLAERAGTRKDLSQRSTGARACTGPDLAEKSPRKARLLPIFARA